MSKVLSALVFSLVFLQPITASAQQCIFHDGGIIQRNDVVKFDIMLEPAPHWSRTFTDTKMQGKARKLFGVGGCKAVVYLRVGEDPKGVALSVPGAVGSVDVPSDALGAGCDCR